MKILFNDIIQKSDAPKEIKSPALSDTYKIENELTINLNKEYDIDCIGLGNCDNNIIVELYYNDDLLFTQNIDYYANGLYLIKKINDVNKIKIKNNVTIGRFGSGIYCDIPTAIAKELTYNSTAEPRVTLSGQVIQGLGGYNYKTLSLDSRYKIDEKIINEIQNGYEYIARGYPFFIDLTNESYKLPINKLYAMDNNQQKFGFESGIKKYLHSRRFELRECF